jgi:hypothetical protein
MYNQNHKNNNPDFQVSSTLEWHFICDVLTIIPFFLNVCYPSEPDWDSYYKSGWSNAFSNDAWQETFHEAAKDIGHGLGDGNVKRGEREIEKTQESEFK